jgi:hypothetical protein
MADLFDHPTVQHVWANGPTEPSDLPQILDANWLKTLCLKSGADDMGFGSGDHPDIADQRSGAARRARSQIDRREKSDPAAAAACGAKWRRHFGLRPALLPDRRLTRLA